MAKILEPLWAKILAGLLLGGVVGFILGPDVGQSVERGFISPETADEIALWLALPGNIFLHLIRFIVIPLVISSVIIGIASSGDVARIRKIGIALVLYFVFTSAVAATIAIAIGSLLAPGRSSRGAGSGIDMGGNIPDPQAIASDIPSAIVNLIPVNPFQSFAQGNMLEIIVAAVIFGIALLVMKKIDARPLMRLLDSVQAASLTIIRFIMWFAPYAVFGLIAKVMIENGIRVVGDLGAYMGSFMVILAAILVFYTLVLVFFVHRSPLEFFRNIREPFIFAFSTSSSSATMPVTLQTAKEKLKVESTIAGIVVPVGATINLDGTAAYQAIVIIFLSQFFGINLDLGQIVLLVALSVAASIGAPGVPGGVLAILVGILADFGIPAEGFALILAVDRLLDMARTSVNVTGDLVACTVMQRIAGPRPPP